MAEQNNDSAPAQRKSEETLTPFIERSITELIRLFTQLFTTPFAFASYNKRFRDQAMALARDDLESAYPETVARPLSFFVLLMASYLALSAHKSIPLFQKLATQVGNAAAVALVGFAMTLIIAVKAYLVSLAGHLLRCRIRFKTGLNASAYAFGTFIFFLYIFISVRYLATLLLPDTGSKIGAIILMYGMLIVSMLLVVRVNQVIQQTDATLENKTYLSWFAGTIAWHFVVVLGIVYALKSGDLPKYWSTYAELWQTFGKAFVPSTW
jgi:hypothetical protein